MEIFKWKNNIILWNLYSEPPRITLEPARQVVRPGDNANLRCAVTGDQPISITWSKQTGSLPPSVIINSGVLMVC